MHTRALRITVALVATMLGGAAAQATVITWTGGSVGTGTSWNDPNNWGGTAPGTNDTAVFASAGITNNKTISLDASQAVYAVTISNTTSFTIGSANDATATNSLTLVNVNRPGTSANTHTIRAPVALASNSIWTVSGSGVLIVSNAITGGSYTLTKDGATELDMCGPNSYGTTYVVAGTLKAKVNAAVIPGNLDVGGGNAAATFDGTIGGSVVNDSASIYARTNGTVKFGNAEHTKNWYLFAGGAINNNSCYMNYSTFYMTGGTIANGGGLYLNVIGITTYATNSMAIITPFVPVYAYGDYTFGITVARGTAPIDLKMAGGLNSGSSSYAWSKSGAGILQLAAASTCADRTNAITAGTLLADNPSGSAAYTSTVTVAAGATLGGTGFVGGVTGNGGVSLTAGASTNSMATIWPGTIDPVSGAHIIGTLTIGSASVSNNVTFGKFTRLWAQLGSTPGSCDQLAVNGYLNLGTTANTNYLDVGTSGTVPKAGVYTVAIFNTLTGRFVAVRSAPGALLPASFGTKNVSYTGTLTGRGNELANGSIVVNIPPAGSAVFIR